MDDEWIMDLQEKFTSLGNDLEVMEKGTIDLVLHPLIAAGIDIMKSFMIDSISLLSRMKSMDNENSHEDFIFLCSILPSLGNLRKRIDRTMDLIHDRMGEMDRTLVQKLEKTRSGLMEAMENLLSGAIKGIKEMAKNSGVATYSINLGFYELFVTLNFNLLT